MTRDAKPSPHAVPSHVRVRWEEAGAEADARRPHGGADMEMNLARCALGARGSFPTALTIHDIADSATTPEWVRGESLGDAVCEEARPRASALGVDDTRGITTKHCVSQRLGHIRGAQDGEIFTRYLFTRLARSNRDVASLGQARHHAPQHPPTFANATRKPVPDSRHLLRGASRSGPSSKAHHDARSLRRGTTQHDLSRAGTPTPCLWRSGDPPHRSVCSRSQHARHRMSSGEQRASGTMGGGCVFAIPRARS